MGLRIPEGSRRRSEEEQVMNERGEWEGEEQEVNSEVDATGSVSLESVIAKCEWEW